jgi:ribosomal protein S18 acetylase RimI-like enzyme
MHAELLDNPLWGSLSTLHRSLARGAGDLLRYPADVAPFLAARGAATRADAELDELVAPGETLLLIGPRPSVPPGWRIDDLGTILQMVCAMPPPLPAGPPIVALGPEHRPAVLALTAQVYPHYFRPRTMELGRYFGIFDGSRLAAMIGERMGMPGYREISAVCTHPDFAGRGLARRLLASLTADIAGGGATPFLHVSPTNARAIELYEQNGYRTRLAIAFGSLCRG